MQLKNNCASNGQVIARGKAKCNFDCYEYNYSLFTLKCGDRQFILITCMSRDIYIIELCVVCSYKSITVCRVLLVLMIDSLINNTIHGFRSSDLRMASFQIALPEHFNFSQPAEWLKWIRCFERFRDTSGLSEKDEVHQVNTLVYCMGDAADDILCTLGLSDDENKVYKTVKTKFEEHFVKWRNVIFERARFNSRR